MQEQPNNEAEPTTILHKLIKLIDLRIYHAGNNCYDPSVANDPFEYDPSYKDKVRSAKECRDAANELLQYIKDKYKKLLSRKDKRVLPQWLYNQQAIVKALDKTRFEDVYGYIVINTLPFTDVLERVGALDLGQYQTTLKTGKNAGKPVERPYCLFIPEYPDMVNELKLSRISIQKYLRKFCDIGILLKLRKKDSRGNNIYAVGYYTKYIQDGEERVNRILFLKETSEIKEALRQFKIRD